VRPLLTTLVALCVMSTTAAASVNMNPSSLTTTSTLVGQTSPPATGTLSSTNNDRVDLSVGSCSGSGSGTFILTPSQSILLSSPKTVDVTYMPTVAGTRTCTVNVFDHNTSTILSTFTVIGNGYTPPMISATTPSAFPNARVLDTSVAAHNTTRQITVQNDGGAVLSITNVTFTGDFSIDPSSAYGTSTTINGGGGAKNWVIRFNPSASGTRTGSVTFMSYAGNATVNLSGTGTTGSYAITQAGNGAFGTVASGSSAGIDIAVTHDGLDPKGPLTFSTVTVSNATQSWFAISAQPTNQITGAVGQTTGIITVTCSPPAGATQTATATVNINADADTGAMKTQNVSCTGGASVLALSIASVDMDPTLVGTTSAVKTITLQNAGTSDANVGFASGSTNGPRFSVQGPGGCGMGANNCAIPMGGGSIMITMTFSPTVEATVAASFNVQGAGAAPSFIVTGRGVDRHMSAPESVQFADEYRNPGSLATPRPVTLMNQGEYPIMITDLQIGGGTDVGSIVEPRPTMIPLLGSVDVMVKFSPLEAGKATDGQLLIMNDDTKVAGGMPIVILSGNGKDRNVDVLPASIDLGARAVGIPTRLSIALPDERFRLKNNEMDDFTIRKIAIEGDGLNVAIDDDIEGSTLMAMQERDLDLVINATVPGSLDGTLLVYLDEDPLPQSIVAVRMTAVSVDIHGGGGCSTGSGAGPLALLGLLALRRRRKN